MIGDIGIGILTSVFFSSVFDIPLNLFFIAFAIYFVLLPDIDLLVYVFPWTRNIFDDHRELTHYPVIYVPILILIGFLFGGIWALFAGVLIVLHLAHDTLWIGSGIKWLWPFSKKAYIFFPQDSKYSDTTQHWIKTYYLRPTVVSVSEYSIFILSVIVLIIYIM